MNPIPSVKLALLGSALILTACSKSDSPANTQTTPAAIAVPPAASSFLKTQMPAILALGEPTIEGSRDGDVVSLKFAQPASLREDLFTAARSEEALKRQSQDSCLVRTEFLSLFDGRPLIQKTHSAGDKVTLYGRFVGERRADNTWAFDLLTFDTNILGNLGKTRAEYSQGAIEIGSPDFASLVNEAELRKKNKIDAFVAMFPQGRTFAGREIPEPGYGFAAAGPVKLVVDQVGPNSSFNATLSTVKEAGVSILLRCSALDEDGLFSPTISIQDTTGTSINSQFGTFAFFWEKARQGRVGIEIKGQEIKINFGRSAVVVLTPAS